MWAIYRTDANNTYSYAPVMVGKPSRDLPALNAKRASLQNEANRDPRSGLMFDVHPVRPELVWVIDR